MYYLYLLCNIFTMRIMFLIMRINICNRCIKTVTGHFDRLCHETKTLAAGPQTGPGRQRDGNRAPLVSTGRAGCNWALLPSTAATYLCCRDSTCMSCPCTRPQTFGLASAGFVESMLSDMVFGLLRDSFGEEFTLGCPALEAGDLQQNHLGRVGTKTFKHQHQFTMNIKFDKTHIFCID